MLTRILGAASVTAGLLLAAAAPAVAAGPAVPFTDPSAHGTIGFCNSAGRQITGGELSARPFVWRAMSTVAATGGYAARGRTAALFAYQPRQQTPAGDWTGSALTASATYADASHPTAAATLADESLGQFIAAYPAQWDGIIELRLYLGAPGQQLSSYSYPATEVRVTGRTWHVVGGSPAVPCASARATSLETTSLSHGLLAKDARTHADGQVIESAAAARASGSGSSAGAASSATEHRIAGDSTMRPRAAADATATRHRLAIPVIAGIAGLTLLLGIGLRSRRLKGTSRS